MSKAQHTPIRIVQVREFISRSEIGRGWVYPSIEEAEEELGWFFFHNCCVIVSEKTMKAYAALAKAKGE